MNFSTPPQQYSSSIHRQRRNTRAPRRRDGRQSSPHQSAAVDDATDLRGVGPESVAMLAAVITTAAAC